ncbi:pre-rRNA processing protein [Chytridiales sp. JEL 0842]|nr:pre-rRNA processing protein [Chytridiales sp. JEL 0842]
MTDSFFINDKKLNNGKRKRPSPSFSSHPVTKSSSSASKRPSIPRRTAVSTDVKGVTMHKKRRMRDDENINDDNDQAGGGNESDDMDVGAIDDMNLERDDLHRAPNSDDEEEEAELKETAAQKRLRLAKDYLAKLKGDVKTADYGTYDAAQIDRDLIAERLQDDALEAKGKLFHQIAKKYADVDFTATGRIRSFREKKNPHHLPLTSIAIAFPPETRSSSQTPPLYVYSSSKDGNIVKWDFWTGKKLHVFPGGKKPTKKAIKAFGEKKLKSHVGHVDQVLCIAASSDGKYLATGGRDKAIHMWSVQDNSHLAVFTQHRDAVAGLAFRLGRTNQLYSCSYDRTIKVWNADELSYVETLFGHQDHVQSIDTMVQERCVTAGTRDKTCRLWKLVEESQLIFRGGGSGEVGKDLAEGLILPSELEDSKKLQRKDGGVAFGGSVDVLAMLDEDYFVSGTDNGAISLWTVTRKKPLYTRLKAHGIDAIETGGITQEEKDKRASMSGGLDCNWITSLATVRYSDMFASGSADGFVRLWRLAENKRSFSLLTSIPMTGFINGLRFFEAPPVPKIEELDETSDEPNGATNSAKQLTSAAARRAAARAAAEKKAVPNVLYLAAAVGQEHRLGRWWKLKGVRNEVKIITLG